jgi:RecA/RadA recombinase
MATVTADELKKLQLMQEAGIKLSRDEKKILKDNDKEAIAKKKSMTFAERMQAATDPEMTQALSDDKDDKFAIKDWIDTGNALFNAQVSGRADGGFPSSRITQLVGINSSGKSYLAIEAAKSAQKLGYYVMLFDSETATSKDELIKRGVDKNMCQITAVKTVEKLRKQVLNALEDVGPKDKLFIIVDSIGNLSTEKEMDDCVEGKETADMTRARLLKSFFRTCTVTIGVKNVCMVCINHVYANINGNGPTSVVGGGSGSLYNSSIIVEFTKAQEKTADKLTTIGACITATTVKSRTSKEKQKVKFSLSFENGLLRYSGMAQWCIDEKLFLPVKKSFKINTDKCGDIAFMKGQTFTKASLTDAMWEDFLSQFLTDYLASKFKYQSSADGILDPEFESEEEEGDM